MSQSPPSDETPIQRALRLKTAAQDAKSGVGGGGGGKHDRKQSAAMASGKSRPSTRTK